METEVVISVVSKLKSDIASCQNQLDDFYINTMRLTSTSWHGGDSYGFEQDTKKAAIEWRMKLDALSALLLRVEKEVDEWVTFDSKPRPTVLRIGFFDPIRDDLHNWFNEETGAILGGISFGSLVGSLIPIPGPPGAVLGAISEGIGLLADAGAAVNDFMQWAIEDWEKYQKLSQEIAATLFDYVFFTIRAQLVLGIDVLNILGEIPRIIPLLGEVPDKVIDVLCWAASETVGKTAEQAMELANNWGIKDLFVNIEEGFIDKALESVNTGLDPSIQQLLTAPASSGVSGSW
jgi:hypothetical protein